MAKTVTKKPAGRRKNRAKASAASVKRSRPSPKPAKQRRSTRVAAAGRVDNSKSAADALIGLLESPLVADVLAAGAAAALAAFTQHSLSRRKDGGSKQMLKTAAKAAAAAMGARISEEIEEILGSVKAAKRGAK